MDAALKRRPSPHPPVTLLITLTILAGLSVVGGAGAALMVLAAERRADSLSLASLLVAGGCLAAGVVVGCVLWAIAHLVRRQSRLVLLRAAPGLLAPPSSAGLEFLGPAAGEAPAEASPSTSPPAEPPAAPAAPASAAAQPPEAPPSAQLLREVLAEMKELNENLLLSAEQREAKRKVRQDRLRRQLAERVDLALEDGDFPRAEAALGEFAEHVPADEELQRLQARLAEARAAAKARDIETYSRQVSDLMAISSFDRAEETARELRQRYPEEPEVAALIDRVLREGKMFRAERRERMFREVERRAGARQWRAALEAAQRFVDAFPGSVDADAVRAMLPTIEDNARIEEVREIRDRIRDLVQRRRYAEAVEAAEDVIRRFPDTRAATELGRQLHRLRELARTPARNGPAGP